MFKNIKLLGILLSKKEKKISLILVFLLLIGAILEMIGLGSLPIYLFAILDSKNFFATISAYKINFIDFFNIDINYSRYDVAFYGAFFLVIFFSLKNIYQFLVAYIQARMIFNISKRNSLDLYKQYIRSEYLYYIDKNPSEIIRNIAIVEDAILFLAHLINISREILLLFFSFFILFFIDVKITFVIFSFFIFSIILILLITKNKSKKFASKINDFRKSEIKELTQSIEGIKDLKVFQQEEFFEKKFDLITGGIYLNKFYLSITHTIPKLMLEIMSIFFISTLLVFFVATSNSFELIIFKLTAYAVVIVRMLPSFSVIASNVNQLRAIIPALQILHREFSDRKKYLEKNASFNRQEVSFNSFNSLVIKNINFFYEKTHPIIKNFSLEVKKGETIGIIGKLTKTFLVLFNKMFIFWMILLKEI
jgi:ABC-type multidrug transport system fused ATPase/permease subunit